MPINFTVVPVEDVEGDGDSEAVAGGSRPPLGKIFRKEDNDENSQGPHLGKDTILHKGCKA